MKHSTTVERRSERELVVTRTFNGPARIVFEAWTKPELIKRWWVPKSMGMSLLSCEMDVRVGGRYCLVFSHPAAPQPMEFFGRYLEVTPHSRLVWTNDEGGEGGAVTTVTFEERGAETLVVMHDLYPSREALDGAIASGSTSGFSEAFEQLDELLVTQGASVMTTSLDGLGRAIASANNVGISTSVTYDSDGRQTAATYPSDTSTTGHDTYAYDDLGRVTSVTHSGGGVSSVAYTGTAVVTTDENGHATTQHLAKFSPRDALITSVTDPASQTWTYTYNALGSLKTVTQPGGSVRTLSYDAHNRLTTENHPESGTTTYTYDSVGNLLTKSDARGTTLTYGHDANNRLTSVSGVAGDSVTMGYDASDNRTSVANGTVASTFSYDSTNRLTGRTDVVAGHSFLTSYAYDTRSNLTQVTYPSGPDPVSWTG